MVSQGLPVIKVARYRGLIHGEGAQRSLHAVEGHALPDVFDGPVHRRHGRHLQTKAQTYS